MGGCCESRPYEAQKTKETIKYVLTDSSDDDMAAPTPTGAAIKDDTSIMKFNYRHIEHSKFEPDTQESSGGGQQKNSTSIVVKQKIKRFNAFQGSAEIVERRVLKRDLDKMGKCLELMPPPELELDLSDDSGNFLSNSLKNTL